MGVDLHPIGTKDPRVGILSDGGGSRGRFLPHPLGTPDGETVSRCLWEEESAPFLEGDLGIFTNVRDDQGRHIYGDGGHAIGRAGRTGPATVERKTLKSVTTGT